MSLGRAKDLASIVSQMGVKNVIIIGGEPTLWRSLLEFNDFCRSLGLRTTLVTNGMRFGEDRFWEAYQTHPNDGIGLFKYMSMIFLKICSIEDESKIVEMTRQSVEFFKQHRIRITWPQTTVEEEYKENEYTDFRDHLAKRWHEEGRGFEERLETFFHIEPSTPIDVKITNYGPMGFYNAGDRSVFINRNRGEEAPTTLKHELIHLLLEPYIQRFKISHAQKEEIVQQLLIWLTSTQREDDIYDGNDAFRS